MAMTADGKIATANRALSSFGSRHDREHLLALRATADAVMCGARTADLNEITLGAGGEKFRRLRRRAGLSECHLRVVVSGAGSLDPRARLFRSRVSPILVLTTARAGPRALRALRRVADEVKICGENEFDFGKALAWLKRQWNVKRLLCEGGGELNDALLRAGFEDELHLTICPLIFGGRTAPTLADGWGCAGLAAAAQFRLKSRRPVGDELFLVFAARR
jgi:riboflavin-specific deaminase-like protein